MGRLSDMAYLLRGAASRIRELGAPDHRRSRPGHLGLDLAWLLAEGKRVALRRTGVVVVSWPKSGRTWLRYMLDQLGIHLEYTHQRESEPLPAGWERKRIILLHRDPRDTTVSHWFAVTRRGGGYRGSLSDFLRDPERGLERAMRFNLSWKDRLGRRGAADGLALSYEALHADTAGELGRAVAFLGGPVVAEEALRRAVAAGRFEAMHALEASGRGARLYGDVLAPGDPADPDSFKTREGRVGGWRAHFSAADAAFAEALLERHDYVRRMRAP
ncbi:MAG TPA: sulfotransferase domain-containing protein [Allosphingosinicella sp.]|nr:sulfotransferase domain-containing protein [Allosphingosinicella sp.]